MKIGILTFHRAINYGAVLQCYALYKSLTLMGHNVEIIDYRPESIEKYRMLFRRKEFKTAKGLQKIRYLLSCFMLIPSKIKTSRKFDTFIEKHLKTSQVVRCLENIPKYYDAIFFGSDQIWSPEHCEGLDKVYYGQFPKGKTKFFAYAASIGRKEMIIGQNAALFGYYLLSFDKISVREIQVQDFLTKKFKYDAELVCDPTLLLKADSYISISKKPRDDNYVLLFDLTNDDNSILFAKKIANQINAKVIKLKAVHNPIHKCKFIRHNNSPEEFIGYIMNARCVVTNSFHATSFSIILHKDFYTLFRYSNNDRSMSLLDTLGLSYRMVNTNDFVSYSTINYNNIENQLQILQNKSIEYISDCLIQRDSSCF